MNDVSVPLTASTSLLRDSKYHPAMALHMAELCSLSYEPFARIRDLAQRPGGARPAPYGYRQVVELDAGATQGVILATPRVIVVAWRGSSEVRDWRDDFRIARVRWPGVVEGRVHAGFKAQMSRVRKQLVKGLRDILAQEEYRRAKVFVTGHSLGGDLATLTPLVLFPAGIEITAVYSIEAARPFNEAAARDYGQRFGSITHRVVAVHPEGQMDLVPRTPPSCPGPWPLGWWHPVCTPQIHWYGERLASEDAWESLRDLRPVNPWHSLRVITNLRHAVSAHRMDFVIKTLMEENDREQRLSLSALASWSRTTRDSDNARKKIANLKDRNHTKG